MSYEAVKWAMDDAPMLKTPAGNADHTARGVLQALAEFAKKDGTDAHPSVERLEFRSGYDRRTVQRALRRLEKAELIIPYGTVNGCVRYRLAMEKLRPASDWDEILIRAAAAKAADAERQRRARERRVTHSGGVTVTHSGGVTSGATDQMSRTSSADVTHFNSVTAWDVTHFKYRCHALSAALTIQNHPTDEPSLNLWRPTYLRPPYDGGPSPLSAEQARDAARAAAHAAKHGTTNTA